MRRQVKDSILLQITFILTAVLYTSTAVSAQSIMTLGEIKTSGSVLIETSNGQWAPSGPTYPLLQNTAVKTEDGEASIFFRDGSRVDLSKETMAVIDGTIAGYTIKLPKGIIAFNISPSTSLSVTTSSVNIFINHKKGLVQKVGYEIPQRTLGVVSANGTGTGIRSISGRIVVNVSASETKLIAQGESIFIGSNGKYKVYKTQAISEKGGDKVYLIRKSDLLEYKTEGVKGTVRVNSDGDIALPRDVSLHVEGLTTSEVEHLIAKEFGSSVLNTVVTILEKEKMAGLLPGAASAAGAGIASNAAAIIGTGALITSAVVTVGGGYDVTRGQDKKKPASPSGF